MMIINRLYIHQVYTPGIIYQGGERKNIREEREETAGAVFFMYTGGCDVQKSEK